MELAQAAVRQEKSSDWTANWCGVLTHTHTYSGKGDHGGTVKPPESYLNLAAWAKRVGVAALGMGSPYTPKTAGQYALYDEKDRDAYYSPGFDQKSVLDLDELERMVREVNAVSNGTLFYLDNETPKGRFGHMWWVGYYPDMPAWHDYDQPFDRWMLYNTKAGDDFAEPIPYERRPYLEILAAQRQHGALGFWAHPTSWWTGGNGQFVTNIASEMPVHAMAQGYIDGLVVMGYQPYRPQYLAIWFEMLDRGYRIPGVAEMDSGLSDAALWRRDWAMLTYIPRPDEQLTVESMTQAFREGRMFASSGPMVDIRVDGHGMGQAVRTAKGMHHKVRLTAMPRPGGRIGRVELLGRGGQVLWSQDNFEGPTVELNVPGLDGRGYLIARVFGNGHNPAEWRAVREFAIGNPVYLHSAGQGFERPMTTDVKLTIASDSEFAGGEVRFEDTNGELLSSGKANGTLAQVMPADGRVTLVSTDGARKTHYLVNANGKLMDVQRYLYRGQFLRDFPSAKSGEVPIEAWRLDEYAMAMRSVELTF